MSRFVHVLLIVFWCASLSVTVLQQSSLLSDVLELWKNRLKTEQRIEKELTEISSTISNRRRSEIDSTDSTASSATIKSLLYSLEQLELAAKASIEKLENELDSDEQKQEDEEHEKAVQLDEAERKTDKHHRETVTNKKLPKIKEMRTECKNYGALDAIHRLVKEVRTKIYEPYPADLLKRYAEGRGNSQIEQIRVSSELSNFNQQIEAVVDHLEKTMPQILELWPRWFKEDGEPIPAPKFLSIEEGGEVHPSEKYGRKAYEEAV